MKIAHIFTTKGYLIAESYIRFVRESFHNDEHEFIVVGTDFDESKNSFPINQTGIIYLSDYERDYNKLIRLLNSYDKIIYHALSIPTKTQIKFLTNKNVMNKIFWVSWGYDLYQWKQTADTIKKAVANVIHYIFRKRIRNFVGIFPPDIEFFKNEFMTNAKTYFAPYVSLLYSDLYKREVNLQQLKYKVNDGEQINIQIGHSSSKILNHLDVLEKLSNFKNENIRIYLPLSYGDKEYGNMVEKNAKIIFGEKVICLREIIEKEKYHDLLSVIDIAIFNTSRQIGLGNIIPLLYMGKKIYLPENSVMYDYYNNLGINMCNYSDIQNYDFKKFIEPIDGKMANEYVKKNILNKDLMIELWEKVFRGST